MSCCFSLFDANYKVKGQLIHIGIDDSEFKLLGQLYSYDNRNLNSEMVYILVYFFSVLVDQIIFLNGYSKSECAIIDKNLKNKRDNK